MDSPCKEINVFLAMESLYNLKWFTAPCNRTPLEKEEKMEILKKIISQTVLNSTSIKNSIAVILYRIGLIPDQYKGRARSIYLRKKFQKKFLKSKLIYSKKGFYYLNPMPSNKFLEEYYEKTYWQSRSDLNYPVRLRDIQHFRMISNFYKDFNLSSKKILNFGSGHGGISFLFHAANHKIYNYDFESTKKNLLEERWYSINSINNVDFKFDLIYGSHSLEHVNNIEETMKTFENLSHEKTIFFFEVPNCYYDKKIKAPHTYYFTREFFLKSFQKVDFCKTFKGNLETNDESGEVIRFYTCSKLRLSDNKTPL